MSRNDLNEAVIRHLQNIGYKFLRVLGRGGFADVIAVRTPTNQDEACKIVQRKKMWLIEDQFWPTLRHPNVLQVNNVIEIEELDVKLYFMPILPNTIYSIVESKDFRKDAKSFNRVKKWLLQVLSALEFLHDSRFCHLDLKTDNVLIDNDDNAVLADFSGLNFTKSPINRVLSPYLFRAPECFTPEGCSNIVGQSYDMWTFSILALNILTRYYYNIKANGINGVNVHWLTQLWPLLKKALKEAKFEKLMKKSFPKANLSKSDINQARHFIQFVMKIIPEFRPSARRAKHHLFLKTISNPFTKDCYDLLQRMSRRFNPFTKDFYDSLQRMSRRFNPFKKDEVELDPNCQGDVFKSKIVKEPSQDKGNPKGRSLGKNVKNWFVRNINRVFK